LKDPEKEVEDLEKAIFYINAEIKDIQERKSAEECKKTLKTYRKNFENLGKPVTATEDDGNDQD